MEVGGPVAGNDRTEANRYYELWRRIANFAGNGPYDEAVWENDRLYLRSDYSEKLKEWPKWAELGDWAAWIIAPKPDGYIRVLSSLKHERDAERTERVEVMFSRFSDATKYVILRIGDSIRSRSDIRLRTLFVNWEARGLDSRIRVQPASGEVIDLLTTERPTLEKDYAEKHLKSYVLDEDANSYGFALDSEQPRMEVLALSFEELTAALLDGMPESITSQVALWRE
ncbi:hypothetical protein [Mycobacterium sp. SP-6446]|uniref:hypothetical protein n=1 Tax=Mycobacterium sp. SP-6446 TaxID=1834162 RepID=UPI0020CA0458|nr:hypothetical protein [Mycobacterium sp. SP-6446]